MCSLVFLLKMNIDLDVFLDFNFFFNFKSIKRLKNVRNIIIILSDVVWVMSATVDF